MTLEALLTFAGILVGALAIARPVQRHSLVLFGSVGRLVGAVVIAFLIIVCRDAPYGVSPPFGWPLAIVLFGLTVGAFLIPVLAAVSSWTSWRRASLTDRNINRIEDLFQAALREREFDEVERIVRKNLENLNRLPGSAICVLFDKAMVTALVDSHSLVHLELLSNMKFLETVGFAEVDAVVRVLLRSETSPLRSAVIKRYGGQEHLKYTEEEQDLIEKTFEKPEWYTSANAHYPLVISAVEALRTGKLDDDYNDIGRDYEADQGISRRSHCPVYLAEKTEVIAIESAIEKKYEGDLYVSDLWNIFRAVLERSRFEKEIWEGNPLSNREFPTPYAYLLYQITFDLRQLSGSAAFASISNTQPPRADEPKGRIPRDLAQTWSFCIWNISSSEGQISPDFRQYAIKQYLIFILELGWELSEVSPGIENGTVGLDAWRDLFLRELQQRFAGDWDNQEVLKEAMESLDQGKRYVYEGQDWLKEKLFGSSSTS